MEKIKNEQEQIHAKVTSLIDESKRVLKRKEMELKRIEIKKKLEESRRSKMKQVEQESTSRDLEYRKAEFRDDEYDNDDSLPTPSNERNVNVNVTHGSVNQSGLFLATMSIATAVSKQNGVNRRPVAFTPRSQVGVDLLEALDADIAS